MSQRAFLAVQTAVAGESLGDAWKALSDSLAICIGYSAEDPAHFERLISAVVIDLREGQARYAEEIAAGRASMRDGIASRV